MKRLKTSSQALHMDLQEHKEEHARLQQHFQVCACRCGSKHLAIAIINGAALDSSVHGTTSAEPAGVACRKATSCSMMPELQSQSMSRQSEA